jgi:transcriptional regulator with XRE-family HTH domain
MTVLAVLRRKKGLTQAALARSLGIPPQELSRLENGWLKRVRPDVEARLRQLFGQEWTLDALLQEPNPRPDAA